MRKDVKKKKQAGGKDSWIVKEFETISVPKKVLKKSWTDANGFFHEEFEFVKVNGVQVYEDVEVCTKAEVVFVNPG